MHCDLQKSAVYDYISLYKVYGGKVNSQYPGLKIKALTMLARASTPDQVRKTILSRADAGEEFSIKQVGQTIQAYIEENTENCDKKVIAFPNAQAQPTSMPTAIAVGPTPPVAAAGIPPSISIKPPESNESDPSVSGARADKVDAGPVIEPESELEVLRRLLVEAHEALKAKDRFIETQRVESEAKIRTLEKEVAQLSEVKGTLTAELDSRDKTIKNLTTKLEAAKASPAIVKQPKTAMADAADGSKNTYSGAPYHGLITFGRYFIDCERNQVLYKSVLNGELDRCLAERERSVLEQYRSGLTKPYFDL
jgi:hypothetical protein